MNSSLAQLDSPRMVLRKITTDDYDDYAQWYQNKKITAYITGQALTEEETRSRFKQVLEDNNAHDQLGWFAALNRDNSQFIGIGKLVLQNKGLVEIGYGLIPELWGAGYGTEMTACLLDHAEQFHFIKTITAIAFPLNEASIKILEKFQFYRYREGQDQQGKPFVEYRKDMRP